MKKISSILSHLGVIALALLALVIATLVWLFERARSRDADYVLAESLGEVAARGGAVIESSPLRSGIPLACEEESASEGLTM